jgi:hypothetical protein
MDSRSEPPQGPGAIAARIGAAIALGISLSACGHHQSSASSNNPAAAAAGGGAAHVGHDTSSPLDAENIDNASGVRSAIGVTVGSNHSFAKVTYKPAVKMIEESGFQATLIAVTPDGRTLVFKNAPADLRALQAGDILMIKNQLARKVLGAETDGEDTFIVTDQATLADLVSDGEINVDAPLKFNGGSVSINHPADDDRSLLDALIRSANAQSPADVMQKNAEEEGTKDALKNIPKNLGKAVLADWKLVTWQATASNGLLNFKLLLAKNYRGFIGRVGLTGFINNFDFYSNLKFNSGVISQIGAGIKSMSGRLQFDWEVAKQTNGGWGVDDLVKLPGVVSVPLGSLLYGLPLTLEVSSALVIHPALTGGNQISIGGFSITMGGRMNTSITSQGAVAEDSTMDETFNITNDGGLTAVAPDAMVIAYAAPRIELTVDMFGSYKSSLEKFASTLDSMQSKASAIANKLLPGLGDSLNTVKAANVLKSNADVYAQLVSTEGVVHSSAISMIPCSRKWIQFEGVVGTAADIAGLTPGAKRSAVVFTKKYDRADPPSNFCEKVGS